jgi:hypothetical protein
VDLELLDHQDKVMMVEDLTLLFQELEVAVAVQVV